MRKLLLATSLLVLSQLVSADTIILRNGSSYTGDSGVRIVNFTDAQGIKYQFPVKDVRSLAFNTSNDTVALRGGKSYNGHFTGSDPVAFQDAQGIRYQFPVSDIDALVFNGSGTPAAPVAGSLIIPSGTDVPIRTNENIDSKNSFDGQKYSASVSEDIQDSDGHVAIPAGSPAQLIIRNIARGGAMHSAELVLDLYSVTVNNKHYRVVSSDLTESNKKGFGANRRTAELLGGGSALGALLGGIFGGGKGAGIGGLAGAGGGFATQAFTRGKEVRVPAESQLRFRLERNLVLHPAS